MDYDVRIISTLKRSFPKSGMLDARPIQKHTGFRSRNYLSRLPYCYHGDYYLNQTKAQGLPQSLRYRACRRDFKEKVNIRR